VKENLTFSEAEPIFPGRKNKPIKMAPPGAHIFRALDGVRPRDVRVIVVGQDPYPKISQATGRSFEQGDLPDWPVNQKVIADSLQRILQMLLVARTGNAAYGGSDSNWKRVIADGESGVLTRYFDRPPIKSSTARLNNSGCSQ
jgi:uracil-DNA glycosylase